MVILSLEKISVFWQPGTVEQSVLVVKQTKYSGGKGRVWAWWGEMERQDLEGGQLKGAFEKGKARDKGDH